MQRRADQQVKIREFRIELGEIEARLIEHSQVIEAVVQPYGKGSDSILVAYIVTDENECLVQNLRTCLLPLLPDYMVPSAYVRLPSLPLTPNGKLDRRALPAPDDEAFARGQYEAPHGEMEEKLAKIWSELLDVDRISRHDNFFALGGHSSLITRLLAQLRQLGLDTTVREVFDSSSLAMLASKLSHYKSVAIPPNLIMEDTIEITSKMLPLITLSQADIDAIITQVPGGVANIQDIYGLTPLQNGMLSHHLMTKEGNPYLIMNRLCFDDRKSLERYVDTIHKVIERHDIFRTAIFWDGLSEPAQVVLRYVPPLLTKTALDEYDKSTLELLSQKFHPHYYRLDLTQAPLLRLMATPTSEESWAAVQLMHHPISDHSTQDRLHVEMHAIMNEKVEMLTTPTPFRDFVAQIRFRFSLAEQTLFFTEMLGDIEEPTLPFGLQNIDRNALKFNDAQLELSQTLSDHLRACAQNFQISLASICHLAWAQVISKASGREAVVFGTVLLGRLQAGEGNNFIMGPTINTLPIRLDIDKRSIDDAVCDIHARLSALLAHEHASLVLAQRCSGFPTGVPLFNTLLNYRRKQKSSETNTIFPGVSFLDSVRQTTYPLTLSMDDDDYSLSLIVQVVSPILAARICAYMQQALESLVDTLTHAPQKPVQKLRVMPPKERTLLLYNWNQTIMNNLPIYCLHQLFETQVDHDGQAIAMEYEGNTLNYSQLNIEVNRLAYYLIARGVKPDDRIALCIERSIEMIIAILGILKAGCAYVPLDPVFPSQRLKSVLIDANPIFLLADATGRSILGDHQIPVIDLDKPLPSESPTDNPNINNLGLSPTHLAYIIYTSGSTGTPKGVMVEHQVVVQFFQNIDNKFNFNKQDKWCLFHSMSFDISVWEIWTAFYCGSQLSIVAYRIAYCTVDFYDWICSNGITVLTQTSSALKVLTRSKNCSSRSNRLRYIFYGAEPSDPMIIKEWYAKNSNNQTVLVHMYGPTETLMVATSWSCDICSTQPSVIPIGAPLQNRRIYLLDSHNEPVLLGVGGEIFIGGDILARGYLNRSETTAERFLPDPFSNIPGACMYRTGDLARYLPDRSLVYLGRSDQQIKIRGFRIEIGEIEARLVENSHVHEAVVQTHGSGSDTYLVAYVVADSDEFSVQNLRAYLLTVLPNYMVPAAYVCLPSLPLTPNGKLDRRALPAPDDEAFARQTYEAPRDEIEEKLAHIWSELLNINRISRHDNFFELGGHSLLVMRFVSKAKLFDVHIDARGLYSFPVLKNLAKQIISRSKRSYCCDAAIPARSHGNETPVFFVPSGDGDISYAFELSHDMDANIPVYALPWSSPESEQPSSLKEMAGTMIHRIRKVQPSGPFAIAGYCNGGILALEIARQLTNVGHAVSFLGLIDTHAIEKNEIENLMSETEIFLFFLYFNFPIFKSYFDAKWWVRASKLTLNEAIEEILTANIDLNGVDVDIEWEAILAKQRYHYQKLCAEYKIDAKPMKIHLFKAADILFNDIFERNKDKNVNELLIHPKLGWENCDSSNNFNIIPVNGDHLTILRNPKNRSVLGKELTKCLQQSKKNYQNDLKTRIY